MKKYRYLLCTLLALIFLASAPGVLADWGENNCVGDYWGTLNGRSFALSMAARRYGLIGPVFIDDMESTTGYFNDDILDNRFHWDWEYKFMSGVECIELVYNSRPYEGTPYFANPKIVGTGRYRISGTFCYFEDDMPSSYEKYDGKLITADVNVTVYPAPSSVSLGDKKTVTLPVGATMTFKPTFKPTNAGAALYWKCSKIKVLDNLTTLWSEAGTGMTVKALKNGSTKLTVKTDNKKTSTITVKVVTPATSVSISGNQQVKAGKTLKLKAAVSPSTASNKKVTWTSSDTSVATVTNAGVVKAKKLTQEATVTITAEAKDGFGAKGEYIITVTP